MAREQVDTAPKRNEIQILNDRRRIADLLLQGLTHMEIRDVIEYETGISLSRRTITNDVAAIRKDWQEQQRQSVAAWVNQELARCDSTESDLWRSWRASCGDQEQETIEKVARYLKTQDGEEDDEYKLRVQRVTSIIKKSGGVGDPRFMTLIINVQQERRRLLGLYAPARLGVDVTNRTEIIVKGYAVKEVSPDAWPEIGDGNVIDGEIVA
jgi:hypothetical protein